MRAVGSNPTEEYLKTTIAGLSKARLDFSEFLKIMTDKLQEADSEEDLLEAFKVFDKDGTGTISAHEVRSLAIQS